MKKIAGSVIGNTSLLFERKYNTTEFIGVIYEC